MGKPLFDVTCLMETVSKLDTTAAAPQVRMIALEDILANKDNFYRVDPESLKPLADSIALDGLQQYPVVMSHPEKEGKYLLLSGHRRLAAIRLLAEDPEAPREDLRLVPCTVREYASRNMAELQLILANSTARVLTSAELSRQAARLEELFYRLKEEEGYVFPGRMRDQVAAACQVSAPKIARLKVIREKLKAPEFLLLFEKNKLPEQAAYALARLPEEFQVRLAGIRPDITGAAAEQILHAYGEGWRWEPDLQCPDGTECRRGDTFLRRDLENYWDMCGGKACCLECYRAKEEYSPCERMCSKAQGLRKEKRDKEKARSEKEKQRQIAKYKSETQANARRVLRAVEAAGLPDEAVIRWGYSGRLTAGDIRAYAAGEFPENMHWYGAELSPDDLRTPAETAMVLGCSTDFLLGMTEELTPSAPAAAGELEAALLAVKWLPGRPDRSRRVVGKFAVEGMAEPLVVVCRYDSVPEEFCFSENGPKIDAECAGWWPVPEEDEDGKA